MGLVDDIKYKQLKGLKGLNTITRDDYTSWEEENRDVLHSLNYFKASPQEQAKLFSQFVAKANLEDLDGYEVLKQATERGELSRQDILDIYEDLYGNNSPLWATDEVTSKEYLGEEQYNEMHLHSDPKKNAFEKILFENSPFYKEFHDQEVTGLGWWTSLLTDKKYIDIYDDSVITPLMAQYDLDIKLYGQENANKLLNSRVQDIVAKNQGIGDSIQRGIKGFIINTATGLMSNAGILEGLYRIANREWNNLLGTEESKDSVFSSKFWEPLWINRLNSLSSDMTESFRPYTQLVKDSETTNGSLWDEIFDFKTFPELISTAGFTTSAIFGGRLISSGIGTAFKGYKMLRGISKGMGSIDDSIKMLDELNRSLAQINKIEATAKTVITPFITGAGEGAINALETKKQFIDTYTPVIDQQLQEAAEKWKLENPELYLSQNGELELLNYISNLKEDLYQKLEDAANHAGSTDFMFNALINTGINGTLLRGLYGNKYMSAWYKAFLKKRGVSTGKFVLDASGNVVAKDPSFIKKAGKITQEFWGEGIQEASQTISSLTSQDYYKTSFDHFLDKKLDNTSTGVLADEWSMTQYFASAYNVLNDPKKGREILYSGIMGALGSTFGAVAPGKKGGLTWRSPVLNSWREIREEKTELDKEAERFNMWLNQGNNREKFTELAASLSWARDMYQAEEQGNAYDFNNAKLGKTVEDFYLLQQLEGTQYYDELMQQYNDILAAEDGSTKANEVKALTGRSLEEVQKEIKYMLDIHDRVKDSTYEIEKTLGKDVPKYVKQYLTYKMALYEDQKDRYNTLQKAISDVDLVRSSEEESTGISKDIAHIIAKHGALNVNEESYNEIIKILDDRIAQLQRVQKQESKARKGKSKKEAGKKDETIATNIALLKKTKEEYVRKLKKDRKIAKDYITSTGETTTPVLSISDILSLDADIRAEMLDSKNLKRYSAAQQSVIKTLISRRKATIAQKDSSSKKPKIFDLVDYIVDAGKLHKDMANFLNEYNELLMNPEGIYYKEMQKKAEFEASMLTSRVEAISKIEDETTFLEELGKIESEFENIQGLNYKSRLDARATINALLKDHPIYAKHKKNAKHLKDIMKILDKDVEIQDSKNKDIKELIPDIIRYLQAHNIDLTNSDEVYNAISELSEDGKTTKLLKYLQQIVEAKGIEVPTKRIQKAIDFFKDAENRLRLNSAAKTIYSPDVEVVETPTPKEEQKKESTQQTVEDEDEKAIVDSYSKILTEGVADFVSKFIEEVKDPTTKKEIINILQNLNSGLIPFTSLEDFIDKFKDKVKKSEVIDNYNKIFALIDKIRKKEASEKIKIKEQQRKESQKEKIPPKNTTFFYGVTYSSLSEDILDALRDEGKDINEFIDAIKNGDIPSNALSKLTIKYSIASKTIREVYRKKFGDRYNDESLLPIIITATYKGKDYFVGMLPFSGSPQFTSKHSNTLRTIAVNILNSKENSGENTDSEILITDPENDNKMIISTGIRFNQKTTDVSTSAESDTDSRTFLRNSLEREKERAGISTENILSATREESILDTLLENLKLVTKKDKKSEKRTTIRSVVNGQEIFFYNTEIKETRNNEGQTIEEVIAEGNLEKLISFNFITEEIYNTLQQFAKGKISEEEAVKKIRYVLYNPETIALSKDSSTGLISFSFGNSEIEFAKKENETIEEYQKRVSLEILKSLLNPQEEEGQGTSNWYIHFPDNDDQEQWKGFKWTLKKFIKNGLLRFNVPSIDAFYKDTLEINNPSIDIASDSRTEQEIINPGNTSSPTKSNVRTTPNGTIIDEESGKVLQKGEVKLPKVKEEVKRKVDAMIEDSKSIKLSEDGTHYESEGKIYKRVTSVIKEGTEEESQGKNKSRSIAATTIGNEVDAITRFVLGTTKQLQISDSEISYIDDEGNTITLSRGSLTSRAFTSLAQKLQNLKDEFRRTGWTIVSDEIRATGTVSLLHGEEGKTEEHISGTIDLLMYDVNGNYRIVDIKTYLSPLGQKTNFERSKERYTKQVYLYKYLLEKKYGIKIEKVGFLPIPVRYATNHTYSLGESGELLFSRKKGEKANKYEEAEIHMLESENLEVEYVNQTTLDAMNLISIEEEIKEEQPKDLTDAIPLEDKIEEVTIIPDVTTQIDEFEESEGLGITSDVFEELGIDIDSQLDAIPSSQDEIDDVCGK